MTLLGIANDIYERLVVSVMKIQVAKTFNKQTNSRIKLLNFYRASWQIGKYCSLYILFFYSLYFHCDIFHFSLHITRLHSTLFTHLLFSFNFLLAYIKLFYFFLFSFLLSLLSIFLLFCYYYSKNVFIHVSKWECLNKCVIHNTIVFSIQTTFSIWRYEFYAYLYFISSDILTRVFKW